MPEKFVDRQYLSYLSKGCNDPVSCIPDISSQVADDP